MDVFFNDILSFPTVIYTFPLIILVLFWLTSFAGLVDMEILDFDVDTDTDADSESGTSSWLQKFGLDGVPLTVALTFVDFYAFIFTYLAKKHLLPLLDGIITGAALGGIIALIAVIIAIPLAAFCIKPLRPVFHTHEGMSKSELIGTLCTVTTQTVSDTFGQATTDDGMILSVRAPQPNDIKKGSRIALIQFDSENDTYAIVTEAELMGAATSTD
jgi:hypothetical protein